MSAKERTSVVKALTEVALIGTKALAKVALSLAGGVVHALGLAAASHSTTSALLNLPNQTDVKSR